MRPNEFDYDRAEMSDAKFVTYDGFAPEDNPPWDSGVPISDESPQPCQPILDLVRPETPPAPWFLWLLPAVLIGLCIVLVVTA